MKRAFAKLKSLAIRYHFSDLFSVGAGVTMGILNVIAFVRGGDNIFAILFCFYFGMALMRLLLLILYLRGYNKAETMDLATALFLFISMPLFNVAIITLSGGTILIKFPLSFLIYGYGAYAFYKFASAILSVHKGNKEKSPYLQCVAALSLLSALYTMMSFTVNLGAFVQAQNDAVLLRSEWGILVSAMIYEITVIILFSIRGFRARKKKKGSPH